MDLTIRPYAPADLDACRGLWTELVGHHREIYESPEIGGDDPGSYFDRYLADPRTAAVWVAESGEEVVGLCGLQLHGDEAQVEPVVVSMKFRGQGAGSLMLAHLVEEARRRKIRTLSIRPVARNERAIACFHRAGFRLLGHLEMFARLDPPEGEEWKDGITIHDLEFGY